MTSTFGLAWSERPGGPNQSYRRYLDYLIDGDAFHDLHGEDLISVLGWHASEDDDRAGLRLLGAESPDLGGRTAIAVCPECGDLLCGAITVRIVRTDTHVQWLDLADSYYDAENDAWRHESISLRSRSGLRFDLEEYERSIRSRPEPDAVGEARR